MKGEIKLNSDIDSLNKQCSGRLHEPDGISGQFLLKRITRENSGDFSLPFPGMVRLDYIVRGKPAVTAGGRGIGLEKGSLLAASPGTECVLSAKDGRDFELLQIAFLPTFLNSGDCTDTYLAPFLAGCSHSWKGETCGGERQYELEELLREISGEYRAHREGCRLTIRADLVRLLVYFRRLLEKGREHTAVPGTPKESVLCSLRYIRNHFTEQISLDQMARMVMLSPSYYSHLFKLATKKTFVEYINLLRIQKAMDLLRDTDGLIVDICYECGFQSVNHFNRMFKSLVGTSPREYRKRKRNVLVAVC